MKNTLRPLTLIALCALAGAGFADLKIGDKAPALRVANIVKGSAVDVSKGIHVVEFWATWCGPCKASIPHLTEMAKRYKDRVDFTGVSVWEGGDDQLGQVKRFVNRMGRKMDYNVAFDGDEKFMANQWLLEAKQDGIPSAFLVKDGEILWIGHPMDDMDKTIDHVLDGTYDLNEAKARFVTKAAEQKRRSQELADLVALIQPAADASKKGDVNGIITTLDAALAKTLNPEQRATIAFQKFVYVYPLDSVKGAAIAKEVAGTELKGEVSFLNTIAWTMIDPTDKKTKKQDYEVALYVARLAAEACRMRNAGVMDTYGLALFLSGQKSRAIEVQTKALELAKGARSEASTIKEISTRLAQFKKG